MQLWYVGDAVKVGDTALRLTGFPDDVARHVNRSYDYLYFNNLVTPGAWQRSPGQIRIGEGLMLLLIECHEGVELGAPVIPCDPRRVAQVEHRIAFAAQQNSLMLGGEKATAPESIIEWLSSSVRNHDDKIR